MTFGCFWLNTSSLGRYCGCFCLKTHSLEGLLSMTLVGFGSSLGRRIGGIRGESKKWPGGESGNLKGEPENRKSGQGGGELGNRLGTLV